MQVKGREHWECLYGMLSQNNPIVLKSLYEHTVIDFDTLSVRAG